MPSVLVEVYWLSDGSELALGATISPDESLSVDALVCEAGFAELVELLEFELLAELLVGAGRAAGRAP